MLRRRSRINSSTHFDAKPHNNSAADDALYAEYDRSAHHVAKSHGYGRADALYAEYDRSAHHVAKSHGHGRADACYAECDRSAHHVAKSHGYGRADDAHYAEYDRNAHRDAKPHGVGVAQYNRSTHHDAKPHGYGGADDAPGSGGQHYRHGIALISTFGFSIHFTGSDGVARSHIWSHSVERAHVHAGSYHDASNQCHLSAVFCKSRLCSIELDRRLLPQC
jgi:hypothetical protein